MRPAEYPEKVVPFARDNVGAAKKAKRHIDGPDELSLCTDKSLLDTGMTDVHIGWGQSDWKTWKTYLGTNKEVFDAKLYNIGEASNMTLKNRKTGRESTSQSVTTWWIKIHIWVISQEPIKRLHAQHRGQASG